MQRKPTTRSAGGSPARSSQSILTILLLCLAFTVHATMTDDWRLHQLAPAPDDARDPAVLRPTPVHELPADDATLPLLPGMTGARSNAPQAERSSGALVASPLAERALAMQTFTVWLEPASTNGFAGWENGWSLLWSPDMNTWSLAAIVTTTNPITVHLTSDNFFFRAQRK